MILSCSNTSLPIELWYDILRWATIIPGALDTSIESPFATPPLRDQLLRLSYCDSLKTKMTFSLVCKSWRHAILPFLFEMIMIDTANYHKITRALDRYSSELESTCHQFVRRLEVDFTMLKDDAEAAERCRRLTQAVRSCSRLKVYRHANHGCVEARSLVTTLLTKCGPSLHDLSLQGFHLPRKIQHILSTYGQDLRVLTLKHNTRRNRDQAEAPIHLGSLHTLHLDHSPNIQFTHPVFTEGGCVNLQHLAHGSSKWRDDYPLLTPSATSTSIHSSNPTIRILDNREWPRPRLTHLLPTYPSLHTLLLSLDFPDETSHLPALASTSIRQVGVGYYEPYDTYTMGTMMDKLELAAVTFSDTRVFPLVAHIRLFGFKACAKEDPFVPFLEEWVPKFEKRSIRFDDEDGNLLRVPEVDEVLTTADRLRAPRRKD